jgi:RNA polymerase sigma-70 factor (ECF subfamily)
MMEISDTEAVRRCRDGDARAFDILIKRHERMVFNLALRMVRDSDDAADVTQSVFIKVYEKLDGFDERFKFFSWLYRIAVNEALSHLERKKKEERLDGIDAAEEEEDAVDDERLERDRRIQDGLMALKEDQRALIILKHMQGLSYEEIGQIMDIPLKVVKSRLYAARQHLRDLLKKKGIAFS